jgi:hypothetical protein
MDREKPHAAVLRALILGPAAAILNGTICPARFPAALFFGIAVRFARKFGNASPGIFLMPWSQVSI